MQCAEDARPARAGDPRYIARQLRQALPCQPGEQGCLDEIGIHANAAGIGKFNWLQRGCQCCHQGPIVDAASAGKHTLRR